VCCCVLYVHSHFPNAMYNVALDYG
jgi:hypothetical protein